jgi:hypothetical protein
VITGHHGLGADGLVAAGLAGLPRYVDLVFILTCCRGEQRAEESSETEMPASSCHAAQMSKRRASGWLTGTFAVNAAGFSRSS